MERSQALNIAAGVGIGVALTLAAQSLVGHSTTNNTEKSQKSQGKKKAELVEDIRNGLEECIGNTPLVRIKSLSAATGCDILGKCEVSQSTFPKRFILMRIQFLEPGGSIKDRVAANMIKTVVNIKNLKLL
jgi:cysteine synthase